MPRVILLFCHFRVRHFLEVPVEFLNMPFSALTYQNPCPNFAGRFAPFWGGSRPSDEMDLGLSGEFRRLVEYRGRGMGALRVGIDGEGGRGGSGGSRSAPLWVGNGLGRLKTRKWNVGSLGAIPSFVVIRSQDGSGVVALRRPVCVRRANGGKTGRGLLSGGYGLVKPTFSVNTKLA